jgi:hypothetical protein
LVILESAKIRPPSCDHPKRQRCSNKIFALDVIGLCLQSILLRNDTFHRLHG